MSDHDENEDSTEELEARAKLANAQARLTQARWGSSIAWSCAV